MQRPEVALQRSGLVFGLGAFSCALYLGRLALERGGQMMAVSYVPILGAVLELVIPYVGWLTVLKAWRVGRRLRRERKLWVGLFLGVLPPGVELVRFLVGWRP